jgi:hypothetical protein
MIMAQTLRDFIVESELFPHSKEHFELVKEATELRLMQMYLENHEFIVDNEDLILEYSESVGPDFFMERAKKNKPANKVSNPVIDMDNDAEEVSVTKEDSKWDSFKASVRDKWEKVKGRAGKIWDGIVSAYHSFIGWCVKMKDKVAEKWDWAVSKWNNWRANAKWLAEATKQAEEFIKNFKTFKLNSGGSTAKKLAAAFQKKNLWPQLMVQVSTTYCPNALSFDQCDTVFRLKYDDDSSKTVLDKLIAKNLKKGVLSDFNKVTAEYRSAGVTAKQSSMENVNDSPNIDFVSSLKVAIADTLKLHKDCMSFQEGLHAVFREVIADTAGD